MKNKDSKTRIQIIIGVMLFTLILTAEIYIMINFPYLFAVLALMVIADLACLYVAIDGIVAMERQKISRQEEQYDSIFKSQKNSYLMIKNCFEEIGEKLIELQSFSEVQREELVNAQKGIAKVIINRNHEDAQALMGSDEEVKDQIEQFQKEVEAFTNSMRNNYEEAMEMQRTSETSTEEVEDVVQDKVKDLLLAIKDMEIRLNGAIMQMQSSGAVQAVAVQKPVAESTEMPEDEEPEVSVTEKPEKPVKDETRAMKALDEDELEKELDEAVRKEKETDSDELSGYDELLATSESSEETESESEGFKSEMSEDTQGTEVIEDTESIQDAEDTEETKEEILDAIEESGEYEPEAIAALKTIMDVEPDDSDEANTSDESDEPKEPEGLEELLEMESLMAAHPDAVMTPEAERESAAESAMTAEMMDEGLKADMTAEPEAEDSSAGEALAEPKADEKPAPKKKSKKAKEKAPEVEKAKESSALPAPDLSDPNKSLSPDEIAALFANIN